MTRNSEGFIFVNTVLLAMIEEEPTLSPDQETDIIKLYQETFQLNQWQNFSFMAALYHRMPPLTGLLESLTGSSRENGQLRAMLLCAVTNHTPRAYFMISHLLDIGASPNNFLAVSPLAGHGLIFAAPLLVYFLQYSLRLTFLFVKGKVSLKDGLIFLFI
jgi:hypothetical protein